MAAYGYVRASTDGQSADAKVKQLRAAGVEKIFKETASGSRPRAIVPRPPRIEFKQNTEAGEKS
ncbi:MAG TPA: recombinase family protein [Methylocella sp.]|jgi:DNA invertase Pin-like site-specific DNA recombinase|nr:recombinase family protein [Methylocella sp.]